jgi:hypothetical protein
MWDRDRFGIDLVEFRCDPMRPAPEIVGPVACDGSTAAIRR